MRSSRVLEVDADSDRRCCPRRTTARVDSGFVTEVSMRESRAELTPHDRNIRPGDVLEVA